MMNSMSGMPNCYREGPPRIFVPVSAKWHPMGFCGGPIGWVEVEEVTECPIVIEQHQRSKGTEAQEMLP